MFAEQNQQVSNLMVSKENLAVALAYASSLLCLYGGGGVFFASLSLSARAVFRALSVSPLYRYRIISVSLSLSPWLTSLFLSLQVSNAGRRRSNDFFRDVLFPY